VKLNEAAAVRVASYGAYVLGVVGAAGWLGAPWGFLVLAVAGAIPGGYLLAKDQGGRQLMKEQAANRPQSYQRPPDRSAPAAPEPLTMPPHAP
jgi:hypothetical protein